MTDETKQSERFLKLAVEGGADGKVYLTDNGRRVFKVLFDRVSVAREGRELVTRVDLSGVLTGVDDD